MARRSPPHSWLDVTNNPCRVALRVARQAGGTSSRHRRVPGGHPGGRGPGAFELAVHRRLRVPARRLQPGADAQLPAWRPQPGVPAGPRGSAAAGGRGRRGAAPNLAQGGGQRGAVAGGLRPGAMGTRGALAAVAALRETSVIIAAAIGTAVLGERFGRRRVSADPGAAAEVRRCAEVTAGLFRGAGAPQVEILDGIEGGQPAVLARCPAPPGKPTVLLYAHHDVQPTGDPGAWTSPPFAAIERDGRLYGRGSADDKAGVAAHLAVLRAYHGRPPVGVTVFVEGEEVIGSPTLGALLERDRGKLAADVIVLADSANFEPGTPALTTTLRGLVDCVVEVRVLEHGVHSGVYGGAAPDALTALCRVLASLHDEQGNVAIDGLVTAKTPDLDYPEERFRAEAGLLDGVQLLGTGSLAGRIWAKPAASVLAIDATRVADASNTLAASARAKVSVRLAPGDDAPRAMRALARHLREHAPWGVRVDVAEKDAGQPYAVDARGPAFDAARAAFRAAYGRDVVDMGVGGSIPFVAEFARTFPGAPILVTSAGADPDCRAHGPRREPAPRRLRAGLPGRDAAARQARRALSLAACLASRRRRAQGAAARMALRTVRASSRAPTIPSTVSAATHELTVENAVAEACAPGWAARVRNRLPNTATPITWESWIVVVSSPLASAASERGTRTSDWVTSGLKAAPKAAP